MVKKSLKKKFNYMPNSLDAPTRRKQQYVK